MSLRRSALVAVSVAVAVASALGAEVAGAAPLPPSACDRADALLLAGEKERARGDYVALLRKDPTLQCAKSALKTINTPPVDKTGAEARKLCARGASYVSLDRDADALSAYKAALEKDPELQCAIDGIATAGPSWLGRALDKVANALPQYLLGLGLALAALFLVLLVGYSSRAYHLLVRAPIAGRILSPRLKLDALIDKSGKDVGDALDARVKERLTRMREDASRAKAPDYELDFGTPREDFAVRVGADSGLKSALDKASEATEKTKLIAALVNVIYAVLPIPRLTIGGVVEPPADDSPAATLRLEHDGGLAAAATVSGPKSADDDQIDAARYLALADPAAVWVQYAVARELQGGTALGPHAAESYVDVRDGLDQQLAGRYRQAREHYEHACALDDTNWSAQLNLAMTEARLNQDYGRAVAILDAGFEGIAAP